jgi:5-methylcytosine-specific restriction enzyme subunit McrC
MLASIREHDYLCTDHLDQEARVTTVSSSSYESLRKWTLDQHPDNPEVLRIVSHNRVECIQARNYVGLIETPEGIRVEILPKASSTGTSKAKTRSLLWKMLARTHNIDSVQLGDAHLSTLKHDWLELLIEKALAEINRSQRNM